MAYAQVGSIGNPAVNHSAIKPGCYPSKAWAVKLPRTPLLLLQKSLEICDNLHVVFFHSREQLGCDCLCSAGCSKLDYSIWCSTNLCHNNFVWFLIPQDSLLLLGQQSNVVELKLCIMWLLWVCPISATQTSIGAEDAENTQENQEKQKIVPDGNVLFLV